MPSNAEMVQWLEDAWFCMTPDNPNQQELLVSPEEIQEIQRFFKARRHPDGARLHHILAEMQTNGGDYVWAFKNITDIIRFLNLRHLPQFHASDHPSDLTTFGYDALYRRFPFPPAVPVSILIVHGAAVWFDIRFGRGPGAGSMSAEVPRLIPPQQWWCNTTYGFSEELALVRIDRDAPFYRINESTIWRSLQSTAITLKDKERARSLLKSIGKALMG